MATRSELRAEVRELIGQGLFDRCFEEGWANEALDFACEQTAKHLGLTYVESETLSVTNRYATLPEDALIVLTVRTITGVVMGKKLMKSTRAAEDMKNPNWRDRSLEPTAYIEETGSTIRLNGVPSTGAVIVGYMQRPTPMATDADSPDARIPEVFHPHLKYAAAAFLYQLDGNGKNPQAANDAYEKFGIMIGVGPLKLSETEVDR